MARSIPEWFQMVDDTTQQVMQRVAGAVSANTMALQVNSSPVLAHWFILDTLLLANRANRDGMHANALALTRQCIEAISVVELGICNHPGAEGMLLKWDADRATPGELRKWLQANVWPNYGMGLWAEPWDVFMREFASAIQTYAHYGRNLAQWQLRLHRGFDDSGSSDGAMHRLIEMRPRAYDPQKATRITLFHALLTYVLGRVWVASSPGDSEFETLIGSFGAALGKSRYLDGHATDWSQQFWTMLWERGGGTILE
ncbi:hypothetical protein DBB29_12360 [Pandoraea cepalis]|uniref:Uncharacterized protein n=1 Tax=Pandoraea cepalis TaxID=2508294 RepID=A0AAW7MLA0_9BURK|nr:hypothetical protein [Pandoraea cepalis]MDN4573371.1 hypothetical protein [Pandoraea cepalis]MDN4578908.1 hypothetical protein [Pandoraea cepalis]